MERDDELAGEGNTYDFGARIYDSRLGRLMSTDPLSTKNSFESPYLYVSGNPIIYIDPTGEDKVYFDSYGNEVKSMRVVSNTEFKAYVEIITVKYHKVSLPAGQRGPEFQNKVITKEFKEAPMPNIIQKNQDGTDCNASKYNKYD